MNDYFDPKAFAEALLDKLIFNGTINYQARDQIMADSMKPSPEYANTPYHTPVPVKQPEA